MCRQTAHSDSVAGFTAYLCCAVLAFQRRSCSCVAASPCSSFPALTGSSCVRSIEYYSCVGSASRTGSKVLTPLLDSHHLLQTTSSGGHRYAGLQIHHMYECLSILSAESCRFPALDAPQDLSRAAHRQLVLHICRCMLGFGRLRPFLYLLYVRSQCGRSPGTICRHLRVAALVRSFKGCLWAQPEIDISGRVSLRVIGPIYVAAPSLPLKVSGRTFSCVC